MQSLSIPAVIFLHWAHNKEKISNIGSISPLTWTQENGLTNEKKLLKRPLKAVFSLLKRWSNFPENTSIFKFSTTTTTTTTIDQPPNSFAYRVNWKNSTQFQHLPPPTHPPLLPYFGWFSPKYRDYISFGL